MAAAAALAIPGLINAGVGAFQMAKASNMPNGSGLLPQGYDPMLLNYLTSIRKRQWQLRSGTDPATKTILDSIGQQNADAMSQVFKTGNTSMIQDTLQTLRGQQGDVMAKVAAGNVAAADNLEGAAFQATQSMAESNKQLRMWKAFQQLREKQELMQTGQSNLGAGFGDVASTLSTLLAAKK